LIGGIELANFDKLTFPYNDFCVENNLVEVEDLLEKYFFFIVKPTRTITIYF
jgi:hypothetical protein